MRVHSLIYIALYDDFIYSFISFIFDYIVTSQHFLDFFLTNSHLFVTVEIVMSETEKPDTMTSGHADPKIDTVTLCVFRGTFGLVIAIGAVINYKLFDNVRKEIHGEKGKVLQRVMKNYAIIQAIGWPCISVGLMVLMSVLQLYGPQLNPCMYVYGAHILIFFYILLRSYVGMNSLIVAIGRYIFVVHDERVLTLGLDKVAKILISSSFMIPFLMSILAAAVLTVEYNGWLAEIQVYENACSGIDLDNLKTNTASALYHSPFYTLVKSSLPDSFTYGLYILYLVLALILFSNIGEAIIYLKSFVFVYR